MGPVKIAHVTSAHKDGDVRIFQKECVSLAEAGFDVYHLVPNSVSRTEKGVQVISFDFQVSSRFKRMFFLVREIYKRALALDADIYHLHDPELLRIALKLQSKGKIVIYDAHEDVPRDIMTKEYIPRILRKLVSRRFERFENKIAARLDGIVTATPFIRDRFVKLNPNVTDINNFPLVSEIQISNSDWNQREKKVCYIGVLNKIRGVREMVVGANQAAAPLVLAGEFRDASRAELAQLAAWKNVTELGNIDRRRAVELKNSSMAGLVIFHPVANHVDAQPNKIFEYMASGLPVIGSDFPLWQKIIAAGNCGICVDPLNPSQLAEAIRFILDNPEKAREMGENGKILVREIYNWDIEKQKLIGFYRRLIPQKEE
ncbi:MAG: glycosyltransferase family 4 protein [Bacteroidetes bacterium]|nr:glycosyltransferase family 4 protein [Bacteroidota bacterium]